MSAADRRRAAIVAPAGLELTVEERELYDELPPAGFILFRRNCAEPEQVRALTAALRRASGRPEAPILIDQEGGRVARLCPPCWPALPPPCRAGELAERDAASATEAAWLQARLIANELHSLGIDVDCYPLLDVPDAACHDVIGDRALACDPRGVAELGRAALRGLTDGGVLPVVKHIPGHGRARADSHVELPVVEASAEDLAAIDFGPFRALADAPFAMTAHVVYAALDPAQPATWSRRVIEDVIRRQIGFRGALISDDIGMGALSGSLAERSRRAVDAGCDLVLYCKGVFDEAAEVLEAAGPIGEAAEARLDAALAQRRAPVPFDAGRGYRRLAELLEPVV